MSDNIKPYQFYYWGPLLFHIKISPEDVNKIYALCHKNKKYSHVKYLAGNIKQEFLINHKMVQEILQPYLISFTHSYRHWYSKNCDVTATIAWVNYMKAGEHNPFHIHTNCDFSSVLYLKMPKGLNQEIKNFKGQPLGPGAVLFVYGEESPYHISWKNFSPKVGDMFIFPYSLRHAVNPFKCSGERISVAVNYNMVHPKNE